MNRYAWTNIGPVCIIQGRWFTTAACRAKLLEQGVEIESWARNWVPFIGWITTMIFIPFSYDQAKQEDGSFDWSAQIAPQRFDSYARIGEW